MSGRPTLTNPPPRPELDELLRRDKDHTMTKEEIAVTRAMTPPLDLAAILARAEQAMALADAATAGPWRVQNKPGNGYGKMFKVFSTIGNVLTGDQLKPTGVKIGHAHRNADFIADARTTVPDLARLVLDLVERVRELEGQFDFRAHLANQREWSGKTFGSGARTAGVIDHIRKELSEIEAKPDDAEEWIDVVILALDGAWRAGHSPDTIIATLRAKQAKNEVRAWPDWRTAPPDKAIEHERPPTESPAP